MKRITALFLGIVLIFTSCAKKFDVETALDEAKDFLKDEDYEEALELYERIIKEDPENYEGYVGAAKAYLGMGETGEALEILEEGLEKTDGSKRIQKMIDEIKGSQEPPEPEPPRTTSPPETYYTEPAPVTQTINVYSFTDEVPNMVRRYLELYGLEDRYFVNATIIATTNGEYQPALDYALSMPKGGPDIYAAESAFVQKYTQGDASGFALPYEDLGINANRLVNTAEIAPYSVQIGTRPSDGEIIGLGYQGTGGAMIYRRSIAIDVWGTDDPHFIASKVSGWDNFLNAANELNKKGYAAVSGIDDVWHSLDGSASSPWIVDGKLYIDPERERFLDIAKTLQDNGFTNDTIDWTDPWYGDMSGRNERQVFAFFGPAWMVNYVMAPNAPEMSGDWAICAPPAPFYWGGTWVMANGNMNPEVKDIVGDIIEWITLDTSDTGLQYLFANGSLWEGSTMFPDYDYDYFNWYEKDAVTSAAVMRNSDGRIDYLGGQNMYDVFIQAGANARGDNRTQYDDEYINMWWIDQVNRYVAGNITRDEAIADFKDKVKDYLDYLDIDSY